MINVEKFIDYLEEISIDFFCGVPDSQLAPFCDYIEENCNNTIAANEGNAVAMASGYHLTTSNFPVVYLQNSGLGNIVNPVSPSNAGDVVQSLVGNLRSCLPPKPKKNRSNIVTNSVKTLKWSTLKKIFFF